jgi:cyclin T
MLSPLFFTLWKAACRLRTSLCLQFKPHHIAAGAIFLAAKFLKVKLPSDGEKVWWQEFDVTPRQLEGWFPPLNFVVRLVWTQLVSLQKTS